MKIVPGPYAISGLLHCAPEAIDKILCVKGTDHRWQDLFALAQQKNIAIEWVEKTKLHALVPKLNHQNILAICHQLPEYEEADLKLLMQLQLQRPRSLWLILDGVQDPHNLGACLRSANAFGVAAVIAPKDRAAGLTPVVRKVACGAAEITPFIQVTNLARTMQLLQQQGIWTVGMDALADEPMPAFSQTGHLALVMGNEGAGLRRLTKKHCDYLVSIPMVGQVESLNVSVATAIGLYALAN